MPILRGISMLYVESALATLLMGRLTGACPSLPSNEAVTLRLGVLLALFSVMSTRMLRELDVALALFRFKNYNSMV